MTDQALAEAPSKVAPSDAPATADATPDTRIIPKGNHLRLVRGGATAAVGVLLAYLLMAENGQIPIAGVPLGIVCVSVAAWGVMDLLGTFDDEADRVAHRVTLAALARPLSALGVGLLAFALSLVGAASGSLSQPVWGVVVIAAFVGLVISVYELGVKLGPWATDELGVARPLWARHGFWLIVASAVLLLPCLGSFSLWDPWETHYGEVSREILARDDWISTWWAQDGFFYSKPVLDFWLQAIFMATLGVHYQPGKMLEGFGGAAAHPEWVVRAPIFLLTVMAIYVLHKGVARIFGRRAGLLGGLVLATMPDWWFLSHQTMTDMPFVGPTATAMGLILIGLYSGEDDKVRLYEVSVGSKVFRLSAYHLVFGAILVAAIPQVIYLFSRNFELIVHGTGPYGFHPHWDEFKTGSGMGNCGQPGNEACHAATPAGVPQELRGDLVGLWPALKRLFLGFEPGLQAFVWACVLGLMLYLNWGERRVRRLAYLGGWFFAALATSAKGPAGFGLPILCGLAYVATTRRWSELLHFELVSGLCIVATVAIPWWVAMYVRHGTPFSDELIFHDLVNRAFSHVHDTNEGDDTSFRFYIWQLGYALFPWTGLAPLGLVFGLRRSETLVAGDDAKANAADAARAQASILLLMWFLFAFALFSFMGTRFHHYIFPAVPPVGMLIGIALDDMLPAGALFRLKGSTDLALAKGEFAPPTPVIGYGLALAFAAALAVFGVSHAFAGSFFGDKGEAQPLAPPVYWLAAGLFLSGAALYVVAARRNAACAPSQDDVRSEPSLARGHIDVMFAGAAVAGALLLGVVTRDLSIKPDNSNQPGAARLLQLFTYRYDRAWPDSLDFSAPLAAFGIVAVVLALVLAVRAYRTHAIVGFLALAMVWAVWGTDVYMPKVAPHWGQREILAAYYASRSSEKEPVVAYQMNWKGENFYSGNAIPAFVSSGSTFTTWLRGQREKGVRVMFFVTEHGRIGGLKGEVGWKGYKEITTKDVNNKFVLVRAEL